MEQRRRVDLPSILKAALATYLIRMDSTTQPSFFDSRPAQLLFHKACQVFDDLSYRNLGPSTDKLQWSIAYLHWSTTCCLSVLCLPADPCMNKSEIARAENGRSAMAIVRNCWTILLSPIPHNSTYVTGVILHHDALSLCSVRCITMNIIRCASPQMTCFFTAHDSTIGSHTRAFAFWEASKHHL